MGNIERTKREENEYTKGFWTGILLTSMVAFGIGHCNVSKANIHGIELGKPTEVYEYPYSEEVNGVIIYVNHSQPKKYIFLQRPDGTYFSGKKYVELSESMRSNKHGSSKLEKELQEMHKELFGKTPEGAYSNQVEEKSD